MANKNGEEKRIRYYAVIIAASWTLIISGFFAWNIIQTKDETVNRAMRDALANFKKDVAFRQWVSRNMEAYMFLRQMKPRQTRTYPMFLSGI